MSEKWFCRVGWRWNASLQSKEFVPDVPESFFTTGKKMLIAEADDTTFVVDFPDDLTVVEQSGLKALGAREITHPSGKPSKRNDLVRKADVGVDP